MGVFKVTDVQYNKIDSGKLAGKCDVTLNGVLTLRGCSVFRQDDGSNQVVLHSSQSAKDKKWYPNSVGTEEFNKWFSDSVLAFLKGNKASVSTEKAPRKEEQEKKRTNFDDDDLPF